jgi:Fic-DOC domain mobile mystery protein B
MDYPDGATPLDPNEFGGLKFKHITTREELDELEQANIESGLRWLARHRGEVLSDDFTVTLHKRMFGAVWNWAGTFRRTGTNIGIDPIHIRVELRMLMDNAQYWADHKTFPGSEAAIRLHHRLVQIHPFPNGNGKQIAWIRCQDSSTSLATAANVICWSMASTTRKQPHRCAGVNDAKGQRRSAFPIKPAPTASDEYTGRNLWNNLFGTAQINTQTSDCNPLGGGPDVADCRRIK